MKKGYFLIILFFLIVLFIGLSRAETWFEDIQIKESKEEYSSFLDNEIIYSFPLDSDDSVWYEGNIEDLIKNIDLNSDFNKIEMTLDNGEKYFVSCLNYDDSLDENKCGDVGIEFDNFEQIIHMNDIYKILLSKDLLVLIFNSYMTDPSDMLIYDKNLKNSYKEYVYNDGNSYKYSYQFYVPYVIETSNHHDIENEVKMLENKLHFITFDKNIYLYDGYKYDTRHLLYYVYNPSNYQFTFVGSGSGCVGDTKCDY